MLAPDHLHHWPVQRSQLCCATGTRTNNLPRSDHDAHLGFIFPRCCDAFIDPNQNKKQKYQWRFWLRRANHDDGSCSFEFIISIAAAAINNNAVVASTRLRLTPITTPPPPPPRGTSSFLLASTPLPLLLLRETTSSFLRNCSPLPGSHFTLSCLSFSSLECDDCDEHVEQEKNACCSRGQMNRIH